MTLDGKACVVTGSTRGIGYHVARKFAIERATVFVLGTSLESAQKSVEEIKEYSCNEHVYPVAINISDNKSIIDAVEEIVSYVGTIDVLVNNAGVTLTKPIEEMTKEDYDKIMNINVEGTYNMIKACLKYMPRGSIINTASMNGINGAPNQSAYSLSKAAVIGLTKSLAKELGSRNIRVNAVAPGMIMTDMVKKYVTDDIKEKLIYMTPLKRIGTPEDLEGVYNFLASDESSFVTGTVISVDGGLIM